MKIQYRRFRNLCHVRVQEDSFHKMRAHLLWKVDWTMGPLYIWRDEKYFGKKNHCLKEKNNLKQEESRQIISRIFAKQKKEQCQEYNRTSVLKIFGSWTTNTSEIWFRSRIQIRFTNSEVVVTKSTKLTKGTKTIELIFFLFKAKCTCLRENNLSIKEIQVFWTCCTEKLMNLEILCIYLFLFVLLFL